MDRTVPRDTDVLADPAAVEAEACRLAELLRPRQPGVVLTWQSPADTVLAHVVARELGASSLRCVDREGLAEFTAEPVTGTRVVIVGVDLRRSDHVRAMLALADRHGLDVVGAGTLRGSSDTVTEDLAAHGVGLEHAGGGGPEDG